MELGNTLKSFTFETNLNSYLLKNNFIILLILISITFSFSSCNSVKYVPENDYLVTKNTVIVNDKKTIKTEVTDYIVQRPNQTVLTFPLPLSIYNLSNQNYETDFDVWKSNNEKRYKRTAAVFSEKQVRGVREFKWGIHQWLAKTGEPPVILDLAKTKMTVDNLSQHYFNEGYFNATVSSEHVPVKKKKTKVNYIVTTGAPYLLDSIKTNVESVVLDSIYTSSINESLIKKGEIYRLSSFSNEQNRITKLFRNSGVYRFNKNAITFEADSSNHKLDVELLINDSIATVPFRVQKIKKINIYTDYSFAKKDDQITDSVTYKGFNFLAFEKLKYNPKYLLNSIFIEPNTLYQDDTRDLTRKNMRDLKNFRTVSIQYTELENDDLEASIYLTPLKKYSIGFNTELTHSNVRPLSTLGKISFQNRNAFKGAEIFNFSIQGSFIDSKDAAADEGFFDAWELGADLSLDLPRFLTPFNQDKLVSKSKSPRTTFTLGASLQKNIGLDKQKFTGIIDYTWDSSSKIKHSFQILNAQYVKNINPDQYFYVYTYEYGELQEIQEAYFPDYPLTEDNALEFIEDEMTPEFEETNPDDYQTAKNIESRYYIITENAFIPSLAYTFTYNNREGFKDNDFSSFRARISAAGNITAALTKKKDSNDVKVFINTPIAQFVRVDLEYKKFWEVTLKNTLAFRAFAGVAVPYGNSETIPFTRSYFIGGPNDLRAWKVYDLGPGSTETGLEYNVGSLKLLTSLEYRYEILNSLKGALFIDAGNIWDISNSELSTPEGSFTGFESFKEVAVGSGFGLRYDLSFILIRLDLGFKTYEPYISDGTKWFVNYNFGNAVYNFGISYPF